MINQLAAGEYGLIVMHGEGYADTNFFPDQSKWNNGVDPREHGHVAVVKKGTDGQLYHTSGSEEQGQGVDGWVPLERGTAGLYEKYGTLYSLDQNQLGDIDQKVANYAQSGHGSSMRCLGNVLDMLDLRGTVADGYGSAQDLLAVDMSSAGIHQLGELNQIGGLGKGLLASNTQRGSTGLGGLTNARSGSTGKGSSVLGSLLQTGLQIGMQYAMNKMS